MDAIIYAQTAEHIDKARELATKEHWHIIYEELDAAPGRPALPGTIASVGNAKGILLAGCIADLADGVAELLHITRDLWKSGADWTTATEKIGRKRQATGRLLLDVLQALEHGEGRRRSARVVAARAALTADGRHGSRPGLERYGFRPDPADPKRLVESPEEQAVLARIKQLGAEGLGPKAIALRLDADGVPCRGARWYPATVGKLLRRAG